jgi:hypothetical protein
MKILKFVGTDESDIYYFPANNCEMIEVASTSSVVLTFSQSGDNAVQSATLTTTVGQSDEVAAIMADYILASTVNNGGIFSFTQATAPITAVSGIALAKTL